MTGTPAPSDRLDGAVPASETLRRAGAQLRLIRAEAERLAERQRLFERASAAAGIGLWECRLRDEALDWSAGVYDLFEIPRGSALRRGRTLEHYAAPSRRALDAARAGAIAAGSGFRLDAEIVTGRGRSRWIRLTATVDSVGGVPVRLFGIKQDITEEKRAADRMRARAERDGMTGLANRMAFEDRLAALCAGQGGLLLLVDLDGFKPVNDTFGHATGDACLTEAARRLAGICRSTDLAARIGGDEFAILLDGDLGLTAAEALAQRIIRAIGRPMQCGAATIRVGASVGLAALFGLGPTEAFARADAALYAAKGAGRNTFRTFRA